MVTRSDTCLATKISDKVSLFAANRMNKDLILISYTKFELNSWRNNEITNYRHFWPSRHSEWRQFKQWLWRHEFFAAHNHTKIISVEVKKPELDRGAFVLPPPPPYKIGSQNTPYKSGLKCCHFKYTGPIWIVFIVVVVFFCFFLSEVEIRKSEL